MEYKFNDLYVLYQIVISFDLYIYKANNNESEFKKIYTYIYR